MGRSPCCDKRGLKKGPWTPEEDEILLSISTRMVGMEAGGLSVILQLLPLLL
ncbi:hypothetical protein CIPAW_12G023400 [Carya illinoinensis]|uniref:Uncharacterized protein n=1 Tax=Carya illinoinensis TaxID=32201 RepID=A0A8T1NVX7_CARIL|nr:hypothetical protein CIPAW_12G023400 [Carya illinoinensis]